jgi:hypothetical protein
LSLYSHSTEPDIKSDKANPSSTPKLSISSATPREYGQITIKFHPEELLDIHKEHNHSLETPDSVHGQLYSSKKYDADLTQVDFTMIPPLPLNNSLLDINSEISPVTNINIPMQERIDSDVSSSKGYHEKKILANSHSII